MLSSQTLIPRFKSKYIPEVIKLESDDDGDCSDEDILLPVLNTTIPNNSGSTASSSLLCKTGTFMIDTIPSFSIENVQQEELKDTRRSCEKKLVSSLNPGKDLSGYIPSRPKDIQKLLNQNSEADKIYQEKCVLIKDGFLTDESIAPKVESMRVQKKKRRLEREKTAGKEWYDLPAHEITPEVAKDIQLLNMRDALDPKRHYKRNSGVDKLKYFHVGTVIGDGTDYYNDLTRKQKKRTMVEELMSDAQTKAYQKKKYSEVIASNPQYLRIKRKLELKKKKRKEEAKKAAEAGVDTKDSFRKIVRFKRNQRHSVFEKRKKTGKNKK
jgi:hypothetical protein